MPTTIPTKLNLSRWFEIMGINPLHANQVYLEGIDIGCGDVWLQYQWQSSDHLSREELALAIAEAEAKVEQYLGFHIAPSWDIDEWHKTTRPYTSDLFKLGTSDLRGQAQTVKADWGYFISGGVQARSLIEATAAIVYSDVNTDGYDETATVTVNTSVTDKNEICIFYPGHSGEDAWEIKPITVAISGGVATIKFRRELVIKEEFLDPFEITPVEGKDDSFFLESVDVYRRYNDPQTQVNFLWEPFAASGCSCNGNGCPQCAYSIQNGCLLLRSEPRNSILGYQAGTWNSDTLEFDRVALTEARQPDIVRLNYYSGYRDKLQTYTNRMPADWERAIAYMACAYFDRSVCACVQAAVDKWREDLALDLGSDTSAANIYRTPSGILDNPFGTRRGEVNAWRKVRDLRIMDAAPVR